MKSIRSPDRNVKDWWGTNKTEKLCLEVIPPNVDYFSCQWVTFGLWVCVLKQMWTCFIYYNPKHILTKNPGYVSKTLTTLVSPLLLPGPLVSAVTDHSSMSARRRTWKTPGTRCGWPSRLYLLNHNPHASQYWLKHVSGCTSRSTDVLSTEHCGFFPATEPVNVTDGGDT